MIKPPQAAETASLPQYRTPHFMERFLEAAHAEGKEIERSPNNRGIKLVDGRELVADALDYFMDNKTNLETEFYSDLVEAIGCTKADLFCDVVAKDWYDGRPLRNGPRVVSLKLAVRRYVATTRQSSDMSCVVENDLVADNDPMLNENEVCAVLTANDRMLMRHIEAWKAVRSDADSISDDDIFFRRGVSLKNPLDPHIPYREWDFINSYSLAFSAPEKFSQMQLGSISAIVSGDHALFRGRVLFFSPFVPNMHVGQLEAGIIPSERPDQIRFQGKHGGILEYILGEQPA